MYLLRKKKFNFLENFFNKGKGILFNHIRLNKSYSLGIQRTR